MLKKLPHLGFGHKVGWPCKGLKLYVDGKKSYELVEGWDQHSKEEKEAILTSLGASNA